MHCIILTRVIIVYVLDEYLCSEIIIYLVSCKLVKFVGDFVMT